MDVFTPENPYLSPTPGIMEDYTPMSVGGNVISNVVKRVKRWRIKYNQDTF